MNKRVLIGVGAAVVALGLAALLWPVAKDPFAAARIARPARFDLPETIVLLADSTKDRHLLMVGSLDVMEVPGTREGALAERRQRELEDALITWLSGRTSSDFEGLEARLKFKRQLRDLAESILYPDGEGRVTAVRFRRLLIQAG